MSECKNINLNYMAPLKILFELFSLLPEAIRGWSVGARYEFEFDCGAPPKQQGVHVYADRALIYFKGSCQSPQVR